jgi:metallo-beta-lactamase family protein
MKTVRVFGREVDVRAEIVVLDGFSAHAGQMEMAEYLQRCRANGPVFLVHGDEPRATTFKGVLEGRGFKDVRVPAQGEEYVV